MLFFIGCDKDESEDFITKNAVILIDESEMDNCLYSIRTEDNESYSTEKLPGEFEDNVIEARITYTLTGNKINCGFGGSLIEIRIVKLVKI